MSLIKYRISWEDDDAIFREIEVLSGQSFYEFHTFIKSCLQLPETMEASFFVADDSWRKEREVSSTVEKNLKDAPALSMKRTPIGALIGAPYQKFIYECVHAKQWIFLIETITMSAPPTDTNMYPRCVRSEGLSPSQIGIIPTQKDSVMEIEEKYDLNNSDGFGEEGEEDDDIASMFDEGSEDMSEE